LGARLKREDLDRLATTLAIMNIVALGFGAIEYVYGVDAVVPQNRNTQLIFITRDVQGAGETHFRIPSIFANAHMYGGTMGLSVPFIAHGLELGGRSRLICWLGIGAAGLSVFLCGSRMPVVVMMVASAYVLVTLRARWTTLLAVAVAAIAIAQVVLHVERMQRFETLGDTDMVEGRIAGSVNESFFTAMLTYPMGAGLATAFGTNIPYFLLSIARPSIGIENEYGRILLEEGIPGLIMWLGFIWVSLTNRVRESVASPAANSFGHAVLVMSWGASLVGAGLLCGIPSTAFLMLLSGMRLAVPAEAQARRGLRNIARAPERFGKRVPARANLPARSLS
jgi:hypothetical protein